MQPLLAAGAFLAMLTGIAHSFLGERLIFRQLRNASLVPSLPAPPLHGAFVRIIWASWHFGSVLAFVLAGLLLHLSLQPAASVPAAIVLGAAGAGFIAGSLLVLIATRGRHPAWLALAAVGVLSWMAIGAQ